MFQESFQNILLIIPPILLALTVHECAHAWMAERMGDHTARMLGRVTLNPIRHLDFIGTLAFLLSGMFGWAKPVPINPRNFKNVPRGIMLTALAGPLSNLSLAAVSAIVYKAFAAFGPELLHTAPGVFKPLFVMVVRSIELNVALAVFNLIPIPPLDGSRVLSYMLPAESAFKLSRMEPYGFIILIVLMFTGVFNRVFSPVVYHMVGLLTGGLY